MTELKPCPFCGGEAELHGESFSISQSRPPEISFVVICKNDLCSASTKIANTRVEAVSIWNTRQPAFDWKPIEELPTFLNSKGEKNFNDDEKFLVTTGNKYGEFICKILANDNLLIFSHGHKAEFPRSKYTHYALLTPPEAK